MYKRKDGRWAWGVTIGYDNGSGNPRRHQGTCHTEQEAHEKAQGVLAKVRSGAHVPVGKDLTVGEFLNSWLELYIRPHREPKTVTYYSMMIRVHLEPEFGKLPLRRLSAPILQRLLNEKAKPKGGGGEQKPLSGETLRGIRATLRSALTRAVKEGLVAENIAQRVDVPKRPTKERQYLDATQSQQLVAACAGRPIEGLVKLTLLTGLRLGEVSGLRWSDVNFDEGTLLVQAQLQRVDGKLTLKGLKSFRSRRCLYLPAAGIEVLRNEMRKQEDLGFSGDANTLNLVFLNAEGRPFDQKNVDKHLKAALISVGLPALSFHKLRHTVATLALSQGLPLTHVRDQLGHSQIALTANTYGHAVPSVSREVSETLARVLGESS